MKKLSLVLLSLILVGCASTNTEVSEPVACSTDCESRYENIKAMTTKFLGYNITHSTSNSFAAQLVQLSPGSTIVSTLNVFKTPESIFIDVDTGGSYDTSLVSNINNLTKHEDFRTIKVHAVQRSVQYDTYVDGLFRISH